MKTEHNPPTDVYDMRTSVSEIIDRLPALPELKLMGEGLPSPFQTSNLREPVNL
jgi:hypothetical protein